MKKCYETEKFILPEPISELIRQEETQLEFSEEENELNLRRCKKKQFYDQKICRYLCSKTLVLESTRNHSISPCESICFLLTRSFDSAGEICPTQKYCRNGCPCPFYDCEKMGSIQKMVPVFDLQQSKADSSLSTTFSPTTEFVSTTSTQTTSTHGTTTESNYVENKRKKLEWITGRWENSQVETKEFPIFLYDLTGTEKQIYIENDNFLLSHERVSQGIFLKHN